MIRYYLALISLVVALNAVSGQQKVPLKVSMSIPGEYSLLEAFQYLEEYYPVKIYYRDEWLADVTADVAFENILFEDAIKLILKGKRFRYRIFRGADIVILPEEKVENLTGNVKSNVGLNDFGQSYLTVGKIDPSDKRNTFQLSGKITDGKTGNPVPGAVVQENSTQQGALSDGEGKFRMNLPRGLFTIIVSSIGYEKSIYQIKILGNGILDMVLVEKSIALNDVFVYGERTDRNVTGNRMSMIDLNEMTIKILPSVAGTRDVLKGLTVMPGVKSIGEFSSGINVRGGGEDQNLYLVDGAPLYYTAHVFGLLSVINPSAVEKLALYKGHIPAYYGQRLSSVVEIQTTEKIPDKIRIKGGVGLYDTRLMAEIPVKKDKMLFTLGGRTSYSDWILGMMNDVDLKNSMVSFYDINGKFHALLPKGSISLSGYTCSDEFRFASEAEYTYGSTLGSFNWNNRIGMKIISELTLFLSKYEVSKDYIQKINDQIRIQSGISSYGLKYSMKYMGFNRHIVTAGFSAEEYVINPGKSSPLKPSSEILTQTIRKESGCEGAIYINDEFIPGRMFSLNTGIRLSGFLNPESRIFTALEPRLSAKMQVDNNSSFKVSYNRNYQYLSLVSVSSVSTPADVWKLSDSIIKPMKADQFAIGYYRNFLNNTIETSVEIYLKSLSNSTQCRDGVSPEMNSNIHSDLITTSGKNYGIELMLKKNSGKIDGWISYSYSRSLRRTSDPTGYSSINNNKWYPSSFDRPHDLSTVINIHLTKRFVFSTNFTFASGRPITLPEYNYFSKGEFISVFSDKNKYRIPDYHRLDFVFSRDVSLKIKKKWKGSWSFSVLNVYGRKNAYTVYFKKDEPSILNRYSRYSLYKLYLIGRPLPTLSLSFQF